MSNGVALVHQWRRARFDIMMADPVGRVRVDGVVLDELPDLGMHIGVTHFVDVTHVPSGLRIAGFSTLGGAMEFVHRIAYLRAWHEETFILSPEEAKSIQDTAELLFASEILPFRL